MLLRKNDTAADVWSYGCVIHEAWTQGEMLFDSNSDEEVVQRLAMCGPKRGIRATCTVKLPGRRGCAATAVPGP